MTAPTLELRVLLADAYRDAALRETNMPAATRAFESIRATGAGEDGAYLAIHELRRQLGQASETRLVSVLIALAEAIMAARTLADVAAVRELMDHDPVEGWAELRRRFAHAIAEFQDPVADGLARGVISVMPDHSAVVNRWIEQMEYMRRERWAHVLDLFESLGSDDVVRGSDRAQLLAREAQVQLYFKNDLAAADRAVEDARGALAADSDASVTAKCEVTCAAAQVELNRNPEKARQLLKEAMEIDPSFEDAYRYMGDAVAADSNAGPKAQGEAEKWYARGIENAPGGTLNLMALARMLGTPEYYQSRRLRVAELRQHALRVAWKNRYSIYLDFAEIALNNGELDDAADLIAQALSEDRSRSDAPVLAARVLAARGLLADAMLTYGSAWAAEPAEFTDWNLVQELAKQVPDAAQARELLEAVDTAFGSAPRANVVATRILLLEKADRWEDAEAESSVVLSDDGDETAHLGRIGRIRNNRANRLYESGKFGDAAAWYERALEAMPEDAVIWGNLAGALERDANLEGRLERLGRAVDAFHRAITLGGDNVDAGYVRRHATLAVKHGVATRYGLRALDRPATKPALGLDVGSDLLPAIIVPNTTELSADCMAAVERVRKRLESESGIPLPGVRFRELESSFDEERYVLRLSGLAIIQGSVPHDRVLLLGAAPPPGAPADRPPASDPLSGEQGYWVTPADAARVAEPHRVITPIEYSLLELAHAYRRNARTEITIDDVARMINTASLNDAAELIGNTRLLHRLTMVVRCLLAEGAPVFALRGIADVVKEAPSDAPATTLVESARMVQGVRERLAGNEVGREVLELPLRWSRLVRDSVWHHDTEPALAIAPDDCQALLAAVRELWSNATGPAVLVTDADIRPFVRWVVELEFPDLAVVSRQEYLRERPATREVTSYAPLMESVR
ncbi:MAG TPA: FHIPEP family type III secretion protein [Gemmatimonadaceae bacterium]|nr:FHIPEP family type III secretion protein [Gemmatimonadaceae bacterium]